MPKKKDKNQKSLDGSASISADEKPIYEPPAAIPIGQLAKGLGATCRFGSAATDNCGLGNSASGSKCDDGSTAVGPECDTGSGALQECNNGPSGPGG